MYFWRILAVGVVNSSAPLERPGTQWRPIPVTCSWPLEWNMRVKKNLPGLMMLAAGFTCGVVVTLMFGHQASSPTLVLERAATSSRAGMTLELDCSARLSSCVCDREAERLKRLARLMLLRSQLTLNGSCFKESAAAARLTPQNVTDLKTFLYPNSPKLSPGIPLGVPDLLKQEYLMKDTVLIGILTQQEYLHTRAQAVYETWGQDVSGVVFFVGEDCKVSANLSHLPIIKLKGIPDHVYPPLKKAFAVMQYMYDNFINQYNWFIRADDDMYVRGELLMDLLKKMSPYEKVYLGRAGVGKDNDLDRLHLLPHERYCMGGPGVIFSNAAMRGVGPYLSKCLNAVFLHDKHSIQKWNDDDVEIGRCISRKLDFQCSTSAESRVYFHTDYAGDSLRPLTLWSKPAFRDIVSMHPVKNPLNMHAIHHFYKTLEFEQQYEKLFDLTTYTNRLCKNLPEHLVPPSFVSTGCNLKLSQSTAQESVGSAGSYLVSRNVTVRANPTGMYDLTYWSFFSKDVYYDVSAVAPRYPLKLSFQAEVNHLQKLLQKYFTRKDDTRDYALEEIVYGYARFLSTTGREFVLRIKLVHKENSGKVRFISVRLLRQFSPDISIAEIPTPTRMINVVLPLPLVDDRFKEFVSSFVQQGLRKKLSLSLVVVVFSVADADSVEKVVKVFTRGFPKTLVTIAVAEGQYSFLQAVEVGISVLNQKDLVFVANVRMRMTQDFWTRCRENTEPGRQAYFPIPFSTYESDFRTIIVTDTDSYSISHWTGQWAFYSFSSFCIIKQDYTDVGGYRDSQYSTDFFERLTHSSIQVFQAPDPGLYQFWTGRTCNDLDTKSRKLACLALQEGPSMFPQPELTEYLSGLGKSTSSKFWYPNTGD